MKKPLRTFYSPLEIPGIKSASSSTSAWSAVFEYKPQDVSFPHNLKLTRLPNSVGDVGSAGLFNQYEFALHLVKSGPPEQWRMKEIEFEQTALDAFVAINVSKDLHPSKPPVPVAEETTAKETTKQSKMEAFDCPFLTPGMPEFTKKLAELDPAAGPFGDAGSECSGDILQDEHPELASSIDSDVSEVERRPPRVPSEAGTTASVRQARQATTDKDLLHRVLGDRPGPMLRSP